MLVPAGWLSDDETLPKGEVIRQLERTLAHPLFQSSQRLSAFLRFAVESVLAGRADQLKETVIGIDVFERGAAYSPQEDPVVRVMAGRLRGRLAEYYQASGGADPIRIDLPRAVMFLDSHCGGFRQRCRSSRFAPLSRRAVLRSGEETS